MNDMSKPRMLLAAATLLALSAPVQANWQMATDFGCLSCHGANRRADAPSLERLAARLAKYRGDAAAEAQFVNQYRSGKPLEHIDAHERISAAAAATLLHWLVEGGK